ncbi:tyrosine-type recombinase/integrase [Clostridium sp.]|uniref:tyrosine-type recombinase/integrase n=1 Tax=Clostridium sp. TaxID=1506 RepID=UPI003D6D3883
MLKEFIYNKEERPVSHYNKEVVMKQFAIYLNNHGYLVYVPEIQTLLPRSKFIPHIYTKEELQRFFIAVDHYPASINSYRNTVDPVLFRFLYGTGTRISEALNLTIADVNLDDGIMTIRHSKNNKDRLIPITESLIVRMKIYMEIFHRFSDNTTFVFPGAKMGHMDRSTAYNHFRDYLLNADISHTSTGPRIHDFRHGLAVACLKKWSLAGIDLTNMLPYLSAYMGHSDFRATQYYLRLTADLYPHILRKSEVEFGYVIPEGSCLYEER